MVDAISIFIVCIMSVAVVLCAIAVIDMIFSSRE